MRNIIYLDMRKFRSLSSQIFEGFSEYVINSSQSNTEQSDEQKGPVGSGRVVADIIGKSTKSENLKFLEDYAFSLFLSELQKQKKLDPETPPNEAKVGEFVMVTGRMFVVDYRDMRQIVSSFNDIGLAIYTTQAVPFVGEINSKDVTKGNLEKQAKLASLQCNKLASDALTKLLEYGYGDTLEIKVAHNNTSYTAPVNREYLRETTDLLKRRYSRISEHSFTLLGVVGQKEASDPPAAFQVVQETADLKQNMVNLMSATQILESLFTGRLENEIIIDPIAIYSEVT